MLIEITEEKRELLTPTEKSVFKWLNTHEKEVAEASIGTIADASFASPATVSRTIRKCGLSGIAELKYKAAVKMNYIVEGEIVNTIFDRSLTECKQTLGALNASIILEAIQRIRFSDKIYLVARGNTALIAKDLAFQLQLLGYNAFVLSDAQIMRNSKKLFKADDVVFIITAKNSTPELEIAARYAKEKEAFLILCCCISDTPLEQYADLSMLSALRNNSLIEEYEVVSRLPLQIVVRTLVDYLVLEKQNEIIN